jgi:hypothetical protein
LLIIDFYWWYLLLIPGGILLSSLYNAWATARWRIWAYAYVADIHQLQRTAELAGLLTPQSHENSSWLISGRRKETLRLLQRKFVEEQVFADDSSVPDETIVYARSGVPLIVLNRDGIKLQDASFMSWAQVYDDRIATVSYSRTGYCTGTGVSAGSEKLFRFECNGQRFELAFSSLAIDPWQLDLLLYIYKGRFALAAEL